MKADLSKKQSDWVFNMYLMTHSMILTTAKY